MDDIKTPNRNASDDPTSPPLQADPLSSAAFSRQASAVAEEATVPAATTSRPKKSWLKVLTKYVSIKHWKQLSEKQRIASLVIIGVLLSVGTVAAMELLIKDPPAPAPVVIPPAPEPEPEPTTAASPLTGVEVPIELTKLPVTGVMIENSPDARPQSGLADAGVVFETIAEGGITRFLALFQESKPDYIGPVRSVRPYYLDFVIPFDAPIAHAGGSAQALAEIRNQGIKDLDQAFNPGSYQRVNSRYAPHNLYTSREQLLALQNSKGFTSSKFTGWPRKEEAPAETPNASKIDFDISGFLYNTHYDYDKASNSYLRSMAGKPHTDERSGKQISPKTIVAIETSYSKNGIYSVYGTTGSGNVTVFQDGVATKGTWSKAGRTSPYEFKLPDGKPLKLNPGQTWITLIQPGQYSFSP